MRFSKNSRYYMNFFLNDVNDYLKKPSPRQQREQDIIIGKIYKDIYNSDIFITNLIKNKRLKKQKKTIGENITIPAPSLLSSEYVPTTIKEYIKSEGKCYLHYSCRIFNRSINIYIILFNKISHTQSKYYDDIIHRMLMWLRMSFLYSPAYCGKNIKIYLYWTSFQKNIPDNTIDYFRSRTL